jgi:4-diphosphocytidyl-2-C-methyl-D-erythritol kinase
MILFPNCKINLGLNVVKRRADGFHDIESLFFPVPLCDALEIVPTNDASYSFTSSGLEIPGDPGQNLCVKAYQRLQKDFDLPAVKMHLHKVIPMGSGLGGGSSDGAHVLKLLNELFDLQLNAGQLIRYAGEIGSDCAFFIENHPQFASGKGDCLEPAEVDLHGWHLVVVMPGVHVSTPEAYKMVKPNTPEHILSEVIRRPVEEWRDLLVNDFEAPVCEKFPVISAIKQQFYEAGAIYASMSGSGSAVFGLFKEIPEMGDYTAYQHWSGKL